MKPLCLTVLIVTLAVGGAAAQRPPAFTVASVKPSAGGEGAIFTSPLPGGGYSARNAPVSVLLNAAYGVSPDRVIGGPDWIRTARFDVEAKYESPEAGAPVPRVSEMLQTLLRERFGLDAALERQNRPIFALRLANGDGRPGPNLRPSPLDCRNADLARQAREGDAKSSLGGPACGIRTGNGSILAGGTTLDQLTAFLAYPAGRVVQNRTGLTGPYDVKLDWLPPTDATGEPGTFLTALQDQLGLKLETALAPIDVLVITSVNRPAAN